jgi:hypothetical protein
VVLLQRVLLLLSGLAETFHSTQAWMSASNYPLSGPARLLSPEVEHPAQTHEHRDFT